MMQEPLLNSAPPALEDLMRRALTGDGRAYASVLQETTRFLRPYLARRLNNHAAVEDVLQEILLSIHKARPTYDAKRPYKPWAFAIAKFRLQDHLRALYSDKLRHAEELSAAENISATENVTSDGLTYESIKEEINQLPRKQAMILTMMHHEGYTSKEIAAKTGMSETAVKVAAHRAYKRLRTQLAED